ncbi:MAG: glycosyltransferase family 2 protein [Bacteroidia bacterium]|nr:glycosyltransferase family 2 protein [Bacteroidia bacterium]
MSVFSKPNITYHKGSNQPGGALFSILIPSWNNLPYLKLCVASLLKNSTYKHQIIIHVNEGTDGTLAWVKQMGYDYTYSTENAGVCYAVNASATLATCNYIAYFNDDMYAAPNWDSIIYDAIKTNGTELFYYSGTMIEFESGTNKANLSPFDFGKDIETFDEEALLNFCKQNANKKDWFGACWPPSVVHINLWKKVGGYTESYSPGFYSDPDFAMKLWQAGVRDYKGLGKSLVYHFKCKSTGRVVKNDGRKTFMKTWGFTSSYLYKNVLKVGEDYNEEVPLKFTKGLGYIISAIKSRLA